MTTTDARLQLRRDTAANWTSNNPTLLNGEAGFITDTNELRIGDGSTAFNSLAGITGGGGVATTGVRTNGYYTGFHAAINTTGVAYTANTLYANFFVNYASDTFTRIGIYVSSAVAGNARLGIYNVENGVPTSLVLDAGTVSTGTTGEKEITISQALEPGVYCLAVILDAAPSLYRSFSQNQVAANALYGQDNTFATYYSFNTSQTYGALPSTHPTPTVNTTLSNVPAVWLRKV